MTVTRVINIDTDQESVFLKTLTVQDANPLFQLIDKNCDHLSRWGDNTAAKYPDLASVVQSILHPENPNRFRYGIWHSTQLVGCIRVTLQGPSAEFGYWVGSEYTGHGHATLALKALVKVVPTLFECSMLTAYVHQFNSASQLVLSRCGFVFDMKHPRDHKDPLLRFVREQNETEAASE